MTSEIAGVSASLKLADFLDFGQCLTEVSPALLGIDFPQEAGSKKGISQPPEGPITTVAPKLGAMVPQSSGTRSALRESDQSS